MSPRVLDLELVEMGDMEPRGYQLYLASSAVEESTLIVLDTGLGKTFIATMAIAHILKRRGGRALFLAPTKPLVTQHRKDMERFFPSLKIDMFTGSISHKKRLAVWEEGADIVIATPQTLITHLLDGTITLDDVSVIVFDESHKGVGKYDYVSIYRFYREQNNRPHTIGLTASPGNDRKKILEICNNLGFTRIEIKSRHDSDVKPYTHVTKIEPVYVSMPEYVRPIYRLLKEMLMKHLDRINRMGFSIRVTESLSQEEINRISRAVDMALARGEGRKRPQLYTVKSEIGAVMSLRKAIEYATTQGLITLHQFLSDMNTPGAKKYQKMITGDPNYPKVMRLIEENMNYTLSDHPKFRIAREILKKYVVQGGTKAIVFTNYRPTCERLVEALNKIEGIRATEFIGQASRGGQKGMTQKVQAETIEKFRDGEFNVLVATSVAEEGLDIPATDLIVFYEPVPSAIRYIQRRGRTGRHREGRVIMLVTRNTVDETYLWASRKKEKKMRYELQGLKAELSGTGLYYDLGTNYIIKWEGKVVKIYLPGEKVEDGKDHKNGASEGAVAEGGTVGGASSSSSEESDKTKAGGQLTLWDFAEKDQKKNLERPIGVDARELRSGIVMSLREEGFVIVTKRLDIGDYLISDRIVVERKTASDLESSIKDGRFFDQCARMVDTYEKPVIIVEGLGGGGMMPEAIYGALAAAVSGFGIPVFMSRSEDETAMMIKALAIREMKEKRPVRLRHYKPRMNGDQWQRYILEGLPGVSSVTARRLLEMFGTLETVFTASEKDLTMVKGIGPEKARAIVSLIRRKYGTGGSENGSGSGDEVQGE